jgi:hypothetical protein
MIARTLLLLSSVLSLRPLFAQAPNEIHRGDRSIGAWVGFSPLSRDGFRPTPRRELFTAAARAEWVIETFGPFALATTSDLIPVAVVTRTPTYITRVEVDPEFGEYSYIAETGNKPVFGAGAAPFGLKLYVGSSHNLRFYGAGAIGGLWFTRHMPVPQARRFNILAEAGGGFELMRPSGRAVQLGYKFHHLSNANTAASNPGLDSHVFYLGLSRLR